MVKARGVVVVGGEGGGGAFHPKPLALYIEIRISIPKLIESSDIIASWSSVIAGQIELLRLFIF